MSITSPNYTQIPNEILDDWMNKLTGAEFKIMMKICRNTFGWQKEKDKISISQIETSTGLGKSQIIKSLKSLKKYDLIWFEKRTGSTTTYSVPVQKVDRTGAESGQVESKTGAESGHTKETTLNKSIKRKKHEFSVPTLEQIEQYKKDNSLNIDCKFFLKYFTESNWIDSKGNKVNNWKLKALSWSENNYGNKTKKSYEHPMAEVG